MIKVLFIGDIYGKPGLLVASQTIPVLRKQHEFDFVIANGENIAGGFGLTEKLVHKLFSYGIDVITSGNHVWDRKESLEYIASSKRVLRPANYPPGVVGLGWTIVSNNSDLAIGVVNLQGRVFMSSIDCPFRTAKRVIDEIEVRWKNENLQKKPCIFIDFPAEATSEKKAIGLFLDGLVSAVIGTHTHIQTADEQILPCGTAYITDAGMTGAHNSVIGVETSSVLPRFLMATPVRFTPAKTGLFFCGVIIEIDEQTGRSLSIERLRFSITDLVVCDWDRE